MFLKVNNRICRFMFVVIWCAQIFTAVYFCYQKKGFHEDEYYTYYSTSRTYGLNIENNAWMEHDDYFNEFVVLEGERFQYGLVKQVQSWDVHPPVYYWLFHTIASLFPGEFSKWYGLVLNLVAFGISMILLWILCLKVTKQNEKLSLLICFFYGFTPAVMSSVVFIRMYALLTVFVLICAVLHVRAVEEYRSERESAFYKNELETYPKADVLGGKAKKAVRLSLRRFLLPISVVTYLGFLTQYYYFIFLFFIGFAFCVYLLWKDRNLWNCIRYALSLATAFVLAYLTYPACLGQMFRGQRGAQATGNFLDVSNTFMRLESFYELMDEYVFGKMFSLLLLVIILMLLYVLFLERVIKYRNALNNDTANVNTVSKAERNDVNYNNINIADKNGLSDSIGVRYDEYFILLFAVVGYFFVVSKTALLLGETSIRYQTPIYGITVLLIFMAIDEIGRRCYRCVTEKLYNTVILAAALISLIINMFGILGERVVFLYPEDEERIAFAREQSLRNTPVVCIYDENQSWCVWDAADEFFEYDKIYFVGLGSTESITDSIISECDELVVYLNNTAQLQEGLKCVMDSNPNLSHCALQYQEKYCDVYYLYGED